MVAQKIEEISLSLRQVAPALPLCVVSFAELPELISKVHKAEFNAFTSRRRNPIQVQINLWIIALIVLVVSSVCMQEVPDSDRTRTLFHRYICMQRRLINTRTKSHTKPKQVLVSKQRFKVCAEIMQIHVVGLYEKLIGLLLFNIFHNIFKRSEIQSSNETELLE